MIKWFWCLLVGHEIDKNDWKEISIFDDEVNGILVGKYRKFWCKRCNKYRRCQMNEPKSLEEWTKDFIESQEPLGEEFEKVFWENYWELLE